MSVTVTLIDDPLDSTNWLVVDAIPDLLDFLIAQYGSWPQHARLYKGAVSQQTDVTPQDEKDILALKDAEGQFYVVNYPGFGIDTLFYVALAATVVAAFVFKPKIPNNTQRTQSAKSPNNELSARTNSARPNGRIPDIFGTVRSTPDLIILPYTTFENDKEVENSLMCIGRGQHEIHDCRDDTTSVFEIEGTDINMWQPYKNLLYDAPYFQKGALLNHPILQLSRNGAVNGQTMKGSRNKTIVGENDIQFYTPNGLRFALGTLKQFEGIFLPGETITISNAIVVDESQYRFRPGTLADLTEYPSSFMFDNDSSTPPPEFAIGNILTIVEPPEFATTIFTTGFLPFNPDLRGSYTISAITMLYTPMDGRWYTIVTLDNPAAVVAAWDILNQYYVKCEPYTIKYDINNSAYMYKLDGDYTVEAVFGREMTLVNPVAVNPEWALVGTNDPFISPTISDLDAYDWIGEFTADNPLTTELIINFVALNGLYGDDGVRIYPLFILMYIEYYPIDAAGTPTGPVVRFEQVVGSPTFENTDSKGATAHITVPPSRYKVRAARQTPILEKIFEGHQIVDEIKWKDFYFGSRVSPENSNYGNVTIVRSRAVATAGALSLKERKLNTLVTRQINLRIPDTSTFTPTLHSTRNVDEILAFVTLDPKIGGRPVGDLDLDNIYGQVEDARNYFGFNAPLEFCYTFDDEMTFEDTFSVIAEAVFCTSYRQGNRLKIKFERRTPDSTLLFNHRNKVPRSETRTVSFGPSDEFDGVALNWVSPVDDAIVTQYIPADRTARKERKVDTIGVRNEYQAYIHAWRYYQKQMLQSTTTKFSATEEAQLCVVKDRILVADNTRARTMDGEVVRAEGLLLLTSSVLNMDPAKQYTISLQLYDGTVQMMTCGPVPGDDHAVSLAVAPRAPLVFDDDRYAKTTYSIVESNSPRPQAFLLTDRESDDGSVSQLTAINYDDGYYAHDNDLFPPIEHVLYLSSRPYVSELADAITPFATLSIHANPTPQFADATTHEISVDSVILTPIVVEHVDFADATTHEISADTVLLAVQPLLSPEDALDPTLTLGIDLATTIFTNAKDALTPTVTLGITKT